MRRRRPLFMMLVCLLLTALAAPVHAAGANADRGGKPGQPTRDPQPPAFTEVSVHDPSIVRHGGTYYVFGSHIEAAKSTDLMNWTRFTNGYTTPGNTLYGDLSANLAGSFAWAGENDADSLGGFAVWAPDVFWNEHFVNEDGTKGAWLIYYSASSTYIRSAIGFAASKHIEGPYTYVDTIVYSGFTRDEAYDANSRVNKKWTNTNLSALVERGVLDGPNPNWFNANGSYNNTLYPNAIDANVFYDKDGRLWMTYGSWSGGIFILELDKQTGRPIYPGEDGTTPDGRMIDRYFGTKIAGGYTKSGEGPYIVYDRETDYYYLYMSYGWLGSDGGYNIRVFRSRRPDGPYVDTLGQNAVLPGNVDHTPYGIKLMGNFLFERRIGEPGEGIGYGYVSPGHNSVYYVRASGADRDDHVRPGARGEDVPDHGAAAPAGDAGRALRVRRQSGRCYGIVRLRHANRRPDRQRRRDDRLCRREDRPRRRVRRCIGRPAAERADSGRRVLRVGLAEARATHDVHDDVLRRAKSRQLGQPRAARPGRRADDGLVRQRVV